MKLHGHVRVIEQKMDDMIFREIMELQWPNQASVQPLNKYFLFFKGIIKAKTDKWIN